MAPVWMWVDWAAEPRPLYSYGLCLAIALFSGAMLFLGAAQRARWDLGAVIVALAVACLGGLVGARLLFGVVALSQGESFGAALIQGGAVFYGGLIGGAGALFAAAVAQGLPVRALFDAAVWPLAVGHAIGRVGCLFGGCCYGLPFAGPWAVVYEHPLSPLHDGLPRHPWPLYEAVAILLLSWVIGRGRFRTGQRAVYYLLGYSVLRLGLEQLRGDALRGLHGSAAVSTSQCVSVLAMSLALWLLWRWRCVPGT